MTTALLIGYAFVFVACLCGSFSERYRANTLQSVGLGLLGIWSAWRGFELWSSGWWFVNEPLLVGALAAHCVGSITKTFEWVRHDTRRNHAHRH